jgi:hypothetical protein
MTMPVAGIAKKRDKSAAAKPAKARPPATKSTREAASLREFREWSERFDRDLDKLVADTERLAEEILRK